MNGLLAQNTNATMVYFDSYIFDIGNVMLSYNDKNPLLKCIIDTDIWRSFECGGDNTQSIYTKLSKVLKIDVNQIADTIEQTKEQAQVDIAMVDFVNSLRDAGKIVVGFTNMPQPFFTYFKKKYGFWDCFTDIYVSATIGLRKPNPEAFIHVIHNSQLNPSKTLFVDDSIENIKSAIELGFKVVHFNNSGDMLTNPSLLEKNKS